MIADFLVAAVTLENRFVREWKANGKKVVGYTCSYLPDEVFHAAGILPYRIRGYGAGECTIGDTYFGPFICSLPKCMLQLAGEGRFRFLDGVIVTPGCDSMRRLDECWRKADIEIGGILPGFFFHFGVPHKCSDYTIKWFSDEIRRLIQHIRDVFGIEVTGGMLRESIRASNAVRSLLKELDHQRTRIDTPLSGAEALAVILAGSAMPGDTYQSMLRELLESYKKAKGKPSEFRLMLVGSANDDVELVKLAEGTRARVVADNLCFSSRFHLDPVPEDGDPVLALARWYLGRNECPRMYGDYAGRLGLLKKKITEASIDGVVLQNIRFCDLHGSENGLFERDLEAAGTPCLRIEREYGPLVEKGRMKIRIDAFLERLEQGRRARA